MSKQDRRAREMQEFRAEQRFHEREWLVQRIGWAILGVVLLGAILGLFGSGPVSKRTIAAGHATFEIDRFDRYNRQSQWLLHVSPAATSDETLRVSFGAKFLEPYQIISIVPEPGSMMLSGSQVVLEFEAERATQGIAFHVQPTKIGWHTGTLRIGSSEPVAIDQLVYP